MIYGTTIPMTTAELHFLCGVLVNEDHYPSGMHYPVIGHLKDRLAGALLCPPFAQQDLLPYTVNMLVGHRFDDEGQLRSTHNGTEMGKILKEIHESPVTLIPDPNEDGAYLDVFEKIAGDFVDMIALVKKGERFYAALESELANSYPAAYALAKVAQTQKLTP